ncbi:MAG: ABC transporter permease [Reichenbachiella sp.]|uniref:ABC transporter permease n=2 Tax=Reichenbachiella sp. TaxID=2184521 RepID=UPI003265FAC7
MIKQLASKFFKFYCHEDYWLDISGDLEEIYRYNLKANRKYPQLRYLIQVVELFRPSLMKSISENSKISNHTIMLKNYFNVAFRSLQKNRLYSFINIFGLAIGLAAFLMINHFVAFEKSYENHIVNKNDIYRVQLDVYQNGELIYKSSENYPGAGPALLEDFPDVISSAKLYNMGSKNNVVITSENGEANPQALKHKRFLYAEAAFLPMFSNQMIQGDAATALEKPFTIVISESMAKKYFGNENPMGKLLRLEDDDFNNELCEVTGVFKDVPENTHLKYDVLISFNTLFARDTRGTGWAQTRYGNGWKRKDFYTYVQLQPNTDPKKLESQFSALVDKYKPENQERNMKDVLSLQKVKDIHLFSQLTDEAEVNGNGDGVFYISIIAFFILIIAWVNYINLSTARAFDRGREVGLRKVMGSYRSSLITQFLVESLVINGLAMLLAFAMIFITTNFFHNLSGTPLSYVIWSQSWFWMLVGGIILIGSLLSGIYPAFVLSSFKPVQVLHGKLRTSSGGVALRKALVIFQFAMSVALIVGTATVFDQMEYMQNRDLGFDMNQTIVVERPPKQDTSRQVRIANVLSFKTGLKQRPEILSVAGSTLLPGKKLRFKTPIRTSLQSQEEAVPLSVAGIDFDFAESMDMKIIAGRSFSEELRDDLDSLVILTENASRAMGFEKPEDAIGKRIEIERFRWSPSIVGVMADYHQENLKEEKPKTLIYLSGGGSEYFMIKINANSASQAITSIEEQWHKSFAGNPFHYFFLDEYFNSYYESERQFKDLFAAFSILAIIVGCLGLFGLSSFTAIQRAREIAIRKVLGSTVLNIIQLLSKEFLILVGTATLIIWPVSYYLMDQWLSNYPYRINIGWSSFLYSGVVVLFVTAVTISYQTLKSATANPVDALNHE